MLIERRQMFKEVKIVVASTWELVSKPMKAIIFHLFCDIFIYLSNINKRVHVHLLAQAY